MGGNITGDFGEWDYAGNPENATQRWLELVDHCLKPGGAIATYYNRYRLEHVIRPLEERGYIVRNIVADCKTNPAPQARKVAWQVGWEAIVIATKEGGNPYQWEEGQCKDWFSHPVMWGGRKKRRHPTEKHIDTVSALIRWWSPKGGLVLDPFLGTGTTAVACKLLGRNCVGIESDSHWCDVAIERFKELISSPALPYETEVMLLI